jgi:ATP-dependent RNA helicase RhlE
MESVTTIINMISMVLIAFVAISLIVSSIMIGVITYISVLERKKEIGILRSIGASKSDVSHVFNYDLPDVPETFVHRIGRTARAGKDGIAISFCAPDEEQDLRAIEKLTKIKIPEGDKTIFEKLPPPQKETPESEMRNARGRFHQQPRQPKKEARPSKNEARPENRGGSNPPAPQQTTENFHNGKRRRNRPGSRARRRMRESVKQGGQE